MASAAPPYGHNNGDLIHRWEEALGQPFDCKPAPRPIANDGAESDDLVQWLFAQAADRLRHEGCCSQKDAAPVWAHDDLLNIAVGKLRRLILIEGERDGQKVRSGRVDFFENFHLELFVYEVVRGNSCIDFDVRGTSPGSVGLRNYGTKYRVSPENLCRLYSKKERFS